SRSFGRDPRGVGKAIEQVADGFLALRAADPELVEPLRAGIAGGDKGGASAVLDPPRRRPDEPRLGIGAREQDGNQRARRKAAGKREERRLAERVGGAAASVLIGADRALARGAQCFASAIIVRFCHWLSPCPSVSCPALRAARDLRFSPTLPASLPARSINGSRARNMVTAATTPVTVSGRDRTASTASSARSAPFSFAPCH